MYGIGQRVVHPMHGAGVIENVTEELLYGVLCISPGRQRTGTEAAH